MSDAAQKHKFLLAAMKMGLQHFDQGGTVNPAIAPDKMAAAQAAAPQQADPGMGNIQQTGAHNSLDALPSEQGVLNKAGLPQDSVGNKINDWIGPQRVMDTVADTGKGLAGAFTVQNGFNAQTAPTANTNYGGVINQAADNALQGHAQAQRSTAQQQAFLDAIRAQNGVGNQSSVFNQMQGVANGIGPNPAQAALNQNTGNNIAAQAALMAGQRGAGANAGLIARQAAMQGANTQQQAVGQAATLQAQQSQNALNQLGGIAQQQVANQQAAQSGLQAGILGEQGLSNQLFTGAAGAQNTQNANDITNWNDAQTINAATAQNNTNSVNKTMGNMVGGASSALMALLAEGGMIKKYADGGDVPSTGRNVTVDAGPGAFKMPSLPKLPGSGGDESSGGGTPMAGGDDAAASGAMLAANGGQMNSEHHLVTYLRQDPKMMAKGGKVPALLSPGEVYLPPNKVKEVAQKGKDPITTGEKIPGKPKHPGNNYANDVVPKRLEVGGIVIPNNVMQSANPRANADKFIAAILAKQNMKKAKK